MVKHTYHLNIYILQIDIVVSFVNFQESDYDALSFEGLDREKYSPSVGAFIT